MGPAAGRSAVDDAAAGASPRVPEGDGGCMTGAASLEPLEPDRLDRVEALLEANDLPRSDVRSDSVTIYGCRADGELVGIGGLELYGSAGLLRSVAVREPFRGQGYGRRITESLEDRAAKQGVETLFLLTTTAGEFFRSLGYREIDRTTVPEPIAATSEFADLCPASAVAMRKRV